MLAMYIHALAFFLIKSDIEPFLKKASEKDVFFSYLKSLYESSVVCFFENTKIIFGRHSPDVAWCGTVLHS